MKQSIFLVAPVAVVLLLSSFALAEEEARIVTNEAEARTIVVTGAPDLRTFEALIRRDEALIDGVDASFGATVGGEVSVMRDRSQPMNAFQPAGVESEQVGISASQRLASGVGLTAGLSFTRTHLSQSEPPNEMLPYPETYFLPRLFIDAQIDLLRDLKGYVSERRRDKVRHDAAATKKEKESTAARLSAAAASLFWNVRALDEIMKTTADFLDNLEYLKDEVKNKVERSLAEPGDLYQLKSLIDMRRASLITLERRRRQLEEGIAALAGGDGPIRVAPRSSLAVGEEKVTVFAAAIDALPPFNRRLSSAYEGYEARLVAAGVQREMLERETLPDLTLVGSYATTGTDTDTGEALREATGVDRDQFYLGLKLAVPLSIEHERSKRELGAATVALTETAYEKRLAVDRAWFDGARARLADLDREIALVRAAVTNGARQLDDLRRRYRQGRIPLYQMVSEEADVLQFHLRLKELVAERIALVYDFTGRFDRALCSKGE